jgi:hypothetical protein
VRVAVRSRVVVVVVVSFECAVRDGGEDDTLARAILTALAVVRRPLVECNRQAPRGGRHRGVAACDGQLSGACQLSRLSVERGVFVSAAPQEALSARRPGVSTGTAGR